MPQNPFQANVAKNTSNVPSQMGMDVAGNLLTSSGGAKSSLNLSAAAVIKATPGRFCKIIISGTVGTGGNYTFNDCASVGAAAASNQIAQLVGTTVASGQPITFDWPCATGDRVGIYRAGGIHQGGRQGTG